MVLSLDPRFTNDPFGGLGQVFPEIEALKLERDE